jgi:hypothetical protein
VEQITLKAAFSFSRGGAESQFEKAWIREEEVPVGNRSIAQWLDEMGQQGWRLLCSRATADFHGVLCEYDFERPTSTEPERPGRRRALHQRAAI